MTISYPRAVLTGLALIVGFSVIIAASTSGVAFGVFNPAWDGTAALRGVAEDAGATTTIVRNTTAYDDVAANGSVAVVLAPERQYSESSASRLRSFVVNGGTLLVADDVAGPANTLLSDVGASARVDGRRLRDEQHYYRGPALPVANDVANHEYVAGVESLTLNHGTAVVPDGARSMVNSSAVAYLDANRNARLDASEPIGPFSVATVEPVGEGRVVVIGDPSALINVMLDRPGNRAFASTVFAAHDRVLLDTSHAGALPPAAYAVLVLRGSPALQVLVGLVAVGLVGLWGWRPSFRASGRVGRILPGHIKRIMRRLIGWASSPEGQAARGLSPETLADYIRDRHPDWEPERVQRVVKLVVRNRSD